MVDRSTPPEATGRTFGGVGVHCIGARQQSQYLNNIVEQDHRAIKWVTRPMRGFKVSEVAQRTLVGIELMRMLKKDRLVIADEVEGLTPVNTILGS